MHRHGYCGRICPSQRRQQQPGVISQALPFSSSALPQMTQKRAVLRTVHWQDREITGFTLQLNSRSHGKQTLSRNFKSTFTTLCHGIITSGHMGCKTAGLQPERPGTGGRRQGAHGLNVPCRCSGKPAAGGPRWAGPGRVNTRRVWRRPQPPSYSQGRARALVTGRRSLP